MSSEENSSSNNNNNNPSTMIQSNNPPSPPPPPFFSMGLSTYQVPLTLFTTNRHKLCSSLPSSSSSNANTIVFLQGGKAQTRNDTDHEPIFRQESFFYYLFGVKEPNVSGVIHVESGKTVLFVPNYPKEYEWWMGKLKSNEDWRNMYQVEEVRYEEEMEEMLLEMLLGVADKEEETCVEEHGGKEEEDKKEKEEEEHGNTNEATILLMSGVNSDSGNAYDPPTHITSKLLQHPKLLSSSSSHNKIKVDTTTLHAILSECRVIKSPHELSLLRYVTELTSMSHVYVLKHLTPGMMEYQGESLFRHYAYFTGGARHVGYTPICGCGPNGAVLHYGHAAAPNNVEIQERDMCLFDMGVEYFGYGSDVTCSFPACGKFTKQQRMIYEGVLNAQIRVYDMLRDGVWWVDCHKAAELEILKALIACGIIILPNDKTVTELVEMRLGAIFMPHGLGHLIGIDTHDVGGYLPGCPERSSEPGLKSLRTARILRSGMTITVEPGCYFISSLLEEAIAPDSVFSSYIDKKVLEEYRDFGGVRLEDVVEITQDGCVNYTICPRSVKEVEYVMGGGKWPPLVDDMPELKRTRLLDPTPLMGGGGHFTGDSMPKNPPSV